MFTSFDDFKVVSFKRTLFYNFTVQNIIKVRKLSRNKVKAK